MANHLAVATATEVLRRRLSSTIGTEFPGVQVSAKRPEAKDGQSQSQVTVFLYRISPNAALRNRDLPTRDSRGRATGRPVAAIDLHYLLSFTGDEQELVPQRMLGLAVSTLHADATLTRAEVEAASSGGWLGESDLGDDTDLVRFSMSTMTLDDLSKLWSFFFQVPYQLSVAYQASVVTIEADVATREPLPVETREVHAVPVRRPEIHSVNGGRPVFGDPAIEIQIDGRQLRGASTLVQFDDAAPQPVAPDNDARIVVPPPIAGGLSAGQHTVRVIHELPLGTQGAPHRVLESNVLAFTIRPTVTVGHAPGDPSIVVGVAPALREGQHLTLLLNELLDPPPTDRALRFAELDPLPTAQPGPWSQRSVDVSAVPAGAYIVRVRVDGAESRLTGDDAAPEHRMVLP